MKQRLQVAVITVLAVLSGFSALHASPTRLSSIQDNNNLKQPTLVAQDPQGNLYVSETSLDVVRIFDRKGHYQKSLTVERPQGIAVDRSGAIYVCSEKKKRIEVYNPDLTFSRVLGEAQGDVRSPSIAIDRGGRIYVVDNFATKDRTVRHDTVLVYDAGGALLFNIGSTGNADGSLYLPGGLAINEALGEVYVVDRPIIQTAKGPISGARIQVFDKKGTWLRTLPVQYGGAEGQMTSPLVMAIDKNGKLYVVDSYQRCVLIFDAQTGASNGALYDMTVPLQIPLGVTIGADNIARVTSFGGASVEEYALDGYVTMDTSPESLAFTAQQYTVNGPDPRTIAVANAGSGTLNWTATKDQAWLTLGGQPASSVTVTGATGPAGSSGLAVGVNITNVDLASGTYTGAVTITSDFGRKDTIPVTLTVVPPPLLSLSNGWLDFTAKKGKNAPPQTISVEILNAVTLPWSATVDPHSPWLVIAPSSGVTTTTATAPCTVSVNPTGLAVGVYSGSISFSAPGALGNGGKLTVNLTVIPATKIKVTTNRPEAQFSLSGPAVYSGTSMSWSVEDAQPGDYTVTYDGVAGYRKPPAQTKTLPIDGEITFSGSYTSLKDLSSKKNIITARGPWIKNDGLLKTYKTDGTPVTPDLLALDGRYGANIASGDIDGDGVAEIIVGTGAGPENTTLVRIFKADKTPLTDFIPYPGVRGGVNVAAADLDNDGNAEIIVAPAGGSENPGLAKVFAYDKAAGKIVPTGVEIMAHTSLSGVAIAAADTEGNHVLRLLTAPVSGAEQGPGSIRIWKIDTSKGMGKWTAALVNEIPLSNRYGATVAAGDMDGDGKDEIIAGVAPDGNSGESGAPEKSLVKIFRPDGAEVGRIPVFDGKSGVNVAAADLDGDGVAEIIVGIGADPGRRETSTPDNREKRKNKKDGITKLKVDCEGDRHDPLDGTVRVYSSGGALQYAITPYEDSRYGVKVAVGDLGL